MIKKNLQFKTLSAFFAFVIAKHTLRIWFKFIIANIMSLLDRIYDWQTALR